MLVSSALSAFLPILALAKAAGVEAFSQSPSSNKTQAVVRPILSAFYVNRNVLHPFTLGAEFTQPAYLTTGSNQGRRGRNTARTKGA
jgi:hypothetical protein